ncbi:preprotein translocase subunit SecE [Phascolarctobacterium faecium]|nr:preprotein translocase subunit SecE [Phascolarctobacterium faecium]MDM8110158.1 preprotein translocase subunit SecE [Phascolarctobacterium faecium]
MAVPELPGVKDTNGIMRFLREAKSELKKVTWPTRRELIAHTTVVFIAVVLSAILIWVIDSIFAGLFQLILQ